MRLAHTFPGREGAYTDGAGADVAAGQGRFRSGRTTCSPSRTCTWVATIRAGNKLDKPRPTDGPLASFLGYHATHREDGKPWRLILNGDIVDFVAITLVPKEPVPFEISTEERALGLAPTELKCVWKLRRTAERHPTVFDAFARFVHRGNSLHIIRGNHDSEWRWPAVQEEFRRILAERSGAPRRKIDRLVEFHDWFYLEPGLLLRRARARARPLLGPDRLLLRAQRRHRDRASAQLEGVALLREPLHRNRSTSRTTWMPGA